ncbi:MAG: hypothetical protein AAFZ15_14370 [Bacteroidota bacterium]
MRKIIYFLPMLLFAACQQGPDNSTSKPATDAKKDMMADPALMQFFEEVNVVKMHLFGTNEAMPDAENYPYVGKEITGDAVAMLGEELRPNEVGLVYGCYHTENSDHFILRVPGKESSSDLAIAKWDAGQKKLIKVTDLAFLMCGEGTCQQQDAWLADLDDSRTLELILRRHTRDAQGNISDESFEVLTDDGSGQFTKSNDQLASLAIKENYVMQ